MLTEKYSNLRGHFEDIIEDTLTINRDYLNINTHTQNIPGRKDMYVTHRKLFFSHFAFNQNQYLSLTTIIILFIEI